MYHFSLAVDEIHGSGIRYREHHVAISQTFTVDCKAAWDSMSEHVSVI